jgi:hypothetical protein
VNLRKSCCFDIQLPYLIDTSQLSSTTYVWTHIIVAGSQEKHHHLFRGCRSLLGFGSRLLFSCRFRLLGTRRLLGFLGALFGGSLLGCLEL